MQKQIVIYSHGFGVRKDDRGLFTDIATALPDFESILFDYNHSENNPDGTYTLTVTPLAEQVSMLRNVINQAQTTYPGATINLICHSQGCIVAGMALIGGIHKTILLAPPTEISPERLIRLFNRRPNGHSINMHTDTFLQRRDGSRTIIPPTYWPGIKNIEPIQFYNEFSNLTSILIVEADQDEILEDIDFTSMSPAILHQKIAADHNFRHESRDTLIRMVRKFLS